MTDRRTDDKSVPCPTCGTLCMCERMDEITVRYVPSATQATGETPRTDAFVRSLAEAGCPTQDHVAAFARQLERELAEAKAQNKDIMAEIGGLHALNDGLLATRSAIESPSIPIDNSMILNAKEAEKVGMDRITISVPIRDILYAPVNGRVSAVPERGARIDLSLFVNAASISGKDVPHIVVEKLQKALDAANVMAIRAEERETK